MTDSKIRRLKQELWDILDAYNAKKDREKFPKDFPSKEEFPVLHDAVETFGKTHQVIKAIEELNELSVELSRWLNAVTTGEEAAERIRGELADVQIMIAQMAIIFGSYASEEGYKYARLSKMLKERHDEEERFRQSLVNGGDDYESV